MSDPNELPIDSRPAARPVSKPENDSQAHSVIENAGSSGDDSNGGQGFKLNLWSLNVAFWNLAWLIFFIYLGFSDIDQQIPLGNVNVTYNVCSFGETDGSCSETITTRVLSFSAATALLIGFVGGVRKRIRRGY